MYMYVRSHMHNAIHMNMYNLCVCRYMNRLAKHVAIRKDDILRDFLENPADVQIMHIHMYTLRSYLI